MPAESTTSISVRWNVVLQTSARSTAISSIVRPRKMGTSPISAMWKVASSISTRHDSTSEISVLSLDSLIAKKMISLSSAPSA